MIHRSIYILFLLKMTTRDELSDAIVNYFANGVTSGAIAEEFGLDAQKTSDILGQAQREWDAVEVDPEGSNAEQDTELDAILEATLDQLLN